MLVSSRRPVFFSFRVAVSGKSICARAPYTLYLFWFLSFSFHAVGFATWSARNAPQRVCQVLAAIDSVLDELALGHGLFKYCAAGGAYVAACGVPEASALVRKPLRAISPSFI